MHIQFFSMPKNTNVKQAEHAYNCEYTEMLYTFYEQIIKHVRKQRNDCNWKETSMNNFRRWPSSVHNSDFVPHAEVRGSSLTASVPVAQV